MLGRMIWLVTLFGCAIVFDGIGLYAMKRTEPMWFWSGSTVKREEIADIPAYNRANGILWLCYSLLYWVSGILGLFAPLAGVIVLMGVGVVGTFGLVAAYNRIYGKYSVKGFLS